MLRLASILSMELYIYFAIKTVKTLLKNTGIVGQRVIISQHLIYHATVLFR
jgi:hypothetical protein